VVRVCKLSALHDEAPLADGVDAVSDSGEQAAINVVTARAARTLRIRRKLALVTLISYYFQVA
jgi:hypothetical protein